MSANTDIAALVESLCTKKEKKAAAVLPAIVASVVSAVVSAGKRITYQQFAALLVMAGSIKKPGPAAFHFLDKLPASSQFVVTRDDGTYHASALAKWSADAPEGYATRPVATNAEFVAIVKATK